MRKIATVLTLASLTTAAFAAEKSVAIKAEGKEALELSVPDDAKVTSKGDQTSIVAKSIQIYVWEVPKAKKVEDGVPHVAEIIKSEFVKFEVKSTDALKVAGHEARHIKGTGNEADDDDAGAAEVVLFTDGKHVYAACTHGEGDHAAKERAEFLKVLATAKGL
jgi:hypothetical protein